MRRTDFIGAEYILGVVLRADDRFRDAVESVVRRIERQTSAEIVVVAASRSGSYRDLALGLGALGAWLALVFVLFSPYRFAPIWVAVEVAVVFGLLAWLVHRSPRLLRLVSTRGRRVRQVLDAAQAAFHEQAIDGTRDRTGLLVYVSLLEKKVAVIPDAGVQARVPAALWNAVRWGRDGDPSTTAGLEEFLAGLDAVGRVLVEAFPAGADNPDELPDAPRIVS